MNLSLGMVRSRRYSFGMTRRLHMADLFVSVGSVVTSAVLVTVILAKIISLLLILFGNGTTAALGYLAESSLQFVILASLLVVLVLVVSRLARNSHDPQAELSSKIEHVFSKNGSRRKVGS
jgi:hypothetical protein